MDNIRLVHLNNYVKPDMDSFYYGNKDYITNGKNNCFFEYIIERYNGSPTNQSIINVYQSLLYGRGLVIKGEEDLYEELYEIFNKTAQRNTLNDFKMFGMAAVKLVRNGGGSLGQIKHFPINKLALEKVDGGGEMKNVWYSFDWKKKYKILGPQLNEQGLIVVATRMANWAKENWNSDLFILLPPKSRFTFLYAKYVHDQDHSEADTTIAKIRTKYWIRRCSPLVRSIRMHCVTCRKRNKRLAEQIMGPYPRNVYSPVPHSSTARSTYSAPSLSKALSRGEPEVKDTG